MGRGRLGARKSHLRRQFSFEAEVPVVDNPELNDEEAERLKEIEEGSSKETHGKNLSRPVLTNALT